MSVYSVALSLSNAAILSEKSACLVYKGLLYKRQIIFLKVAMLILSTSCDVERARAHMSIPVIGKTKHVSENRLSFYSQHSVVGVNSKHEK